MKADRLGMWLVNFLLTAAFAFSLLVLMEQLPAWGWEWYSRSLRALPVVLCFVFGLVARRGGRLRYVLLPISELVAVAAIWLLLPTHSGFEIAYLVFSVLLGAGVFLLGLRGDQPFPPKVALAAIVVYIFDCVYFYLNTGVKNEIMPVTYCALGAFLLSLYSFNSNSLNNGLHNVKGGTVMVVPAGLRSRNIIMLTFFLAVTVPLASLSFLHKGLSAGLGFIMRCIWNIISALTSGGGDYSFDSSSQQKDELPETSIALDPGSSDGVFVPVFIIIMLILALIAAICIFVPKSGGRGGRGRFREWMKKLFAVRNVEAYEDSVERLLDWKGLIRKGKKGVKSFFTRIASVPEKFEDMPDERMKVRFAYKYLLKSSRVNRRAVYYTPAELGAELEMEEVQALGEAYNIARYNMCGKVTAEQAAVARSAMTAIRSKRK